MDHLLKFNNSSLDYVRSLSHYRLHNASSVTY